MPADAIRRAEEVLFALNPNYIGAECCIFCGVSWSMWAHAAVNPDGDRKGICPSCARFHGFTGNRWSYNSGPEPFLQKIREGFYD